MNFASQRAVSLRLGRIHSCSVCLSRGMASRLVAVPEARRFVREAMEAVGTCREHATALADLLVEADCRGHYSHGLNRLELYLEDVKIGMCASNNKPAVLKESPSTAWVDGNNSLGAVVGNYCMQLAMDKARATGVGWVSAKGSNHFGIASWYSMMAAKQGLIAALGTNPISVAAPASQGDSFVLDMATTAVAIGKIEMQLRKNEPIPEGWAQGPDGRPTTDPGLAIRTACLSPLGGEERTSGYKGSGLSLMVETFCGILSGSLFGPHVHMWAPVDNPKVADLGQSFVALDPGCFAPGFQDRMSDLLQHLRGMEPTDPQKPVLVAGDKEWMHNQMVDEQGGILYHDNQLTAAAVLAETLGIRPMKVN
ncbi:uncharacterized oxidoreductase YjmC-like isoform X2 [Bacillus rossius redtenbacheri]|uniref:uncharacterized oxidoreductase YjmC-like isoform X2 n=1 Tax=Bacillus rossius redtenbacheri TaxID=93214 RepID=UPI002FDE0086